MGHYYSKNPEVESNESIIEYHLTPMSLKLSTDNGVFSKGDVDFGSKVLVKAFLEDQQEVKSLLDVGCGYGTIGLMIKKHLPAIQLHMVDVNERAMALAKKNAIQNDISDVKVYESDTLDQVTESFDAIVTNPPIRAGKEVVHRILENSIHHLNVGGAIYVVIQKKQGMPSAKKKLEALFGNVDVIAKDKGYFILKSIKG